MQVQYKLSSCSRLCAKTERTIQPGESYFSAVEFNGEELERKDYCADAWTGPSESHVAWWQSKVPSPNSSLVRLAPNDVLLNLFIELADNSHEQEFRYLLGLVLVRKKVVRLVESVRGTDGGELLLLDCPRRNERFEVTVAEPDAQQIDRLQQRMMQLLYSDGE